MDESRVISVKDFVFMVNLIDMVAERGAFKGNELYQVGQFREKIAGFVVEQQSATEKPSVTVVEDEEN